MAGLIERELGVQPDLIEGGRGEFTVWVGDRLVAKKGLLMFPADKRVLAAVRHALAE